MRHRAQPAQDIIGQVTRDDAAGRAAAAEEAIAQRHLRRLFGLPGTELGVVSWPAAPTHRLWLEWHYWWQAHLIDCLVDAHLRDPRPERVERLRRVTRSHRLRNLTGWTNRYYDDMAWLGLALERADRHAGIRHRSGLAALTRQVTDAWHDREVTDDGTVVRIGGLPWRKRDDFVNTPAAGPAAILLARTGRVDRAATMLEWVHTVLHDPATGLILDGYRPGSGLVTALYSYCQGVVIGAGVELARRTGDRTVVTRVADLIRAVDRELCRDHVIAGRGGGDGGLFDGILARYLALAATDLPDNGEPGAGDARRLAGDIVLASAAACWEHRATVHPRADAAALPLFGHDWTVPAVVPGRGATGQVIDGATISSVVPERDLSVQLGAWKLLEAAARLSAHASSGRP